MKNCFELYGHLDPMTSKMLWDEFETNVQLLYTKSYISIASGHSTLPSYLNIDSKDVISIVDDYESHRVYKKKKVLYIP